MQMRLLTFKINTFGVSLGVMGNIVSYEKEVTKRKQYKTTILYFICFGTYLLISYLGFATNTNSTKC